MRPVLGDTMGPELVILRDAPDLGDAVGSALNDTVESVLSETLRAVMGDAVGRALGVIL